MKFNPYFPGAGVIPYFLSGRDSEIKVFQEQLSKVAYGFPPRPIVLYGLRGVGKTSLLLKLKNLANEQKWMSPLIEGTPNRGIRDLLSDELNEYLLEFARPDMKSKVIDTALKTASLFRTNLDQSGNWSFGVDLSNVYGSNAASGNIENDLFKVMRDTSLLAKNQKVGLALFIDEAQELSKEDLGAVSTLAHKVGQERLPILIVLAGLPSLPKVLAESKSYAERLYQYFTIDRLDDDQAKDALIKPALAQDVSFMKDATEAVVKRTGGYPYFIQEYGFHIWEEFSDSSPITLSMVEVAEKSTIATLDQGFFRSRWDRASQGQKEFLKKMAMDENFSLMSDIALRLGKASSSISPVRAELIKKGLIYQVAPGKVGFTVPRMNYFINRQTLDSEE